MGGRSITMKINEITETYRLDEGLGDYIFQKIDDFLDIPKPHPHAAAKAVEKAPSNLPDDVAEKLVAEFLKKKDHELLLIQAAEEQKTTKEKIIPYLTYFAREFKRRWEQIPQETRRNAWKNFVMSLVRLLLFILQVLAKGKK